MKPVTTFKVSVLSLAVISTLFACVESTEVDLSRQKVSLSQITAINPPVEAQTPKAFKSASTPAKPSARSVNDCDTLTGDPDDPTSEKSQCLAIQEIKSRFFGAQGPTVLRTILADVDSSVAAMIGDGTYYIPCLDRENTAGGTLDSISYEAFSEQQMSLSKTFADSTRYDANVNYYLSCVRGDESSWSGIGQKDGVTYLQHTSGATGDLAIIDASSNIDYWVTFNGLASAFDPANPVENAGTGVPADIRTYEGTTGLVHVRSNAGNNKMELTMTGVGLGDGCGARLITDGSYLFYQANRNYPGRCDENSTDVTIYADGVIDTNRVYDANIAALDYCFQVNENEPVIVAESLCTDRGLSSDEFSIETLTYYDLKAYNAPQIFASMPQGVPAFTSIDRPYGLLADVNDLSTLSQSNVYFVNTAHTNSRTAGFCKDQDGTIPATIDTTFELDLSNLSVQELTDLNSANAILVRMLVDNGFTEKNDYNYWSDFSATITLKLNDTVVGSGASVTTDSIDGVQEINLVVSEGTMFSATDKLTINMSGSSVYACSTNAPGLGSAASGVSIGRARLVYYNVPENSELQQ